MSKKQRNIPQYSRPTKGYQQNMSRNMMKDKELAKKINGECTQRIVYYGALADSVFGYTTNTLINTVIETGEMI